MSLVMISRITSLYYSRVLFIFIYTILSLHRSVQGVIICVRNLNDVCKSFDVRLLYDKPVEYDDSIAFKVDLRIDNSREINGYNYIIEIISIVIGSGVICLFVWCGICMRKRCALSQHGSDRERERNKRKRNNKRKCKFCAGICFYDKDNEHYEEVSLPNREVPPVPPRSRASLMYRLNNNENHKEERNCNDNYNIETAGNAIINDIDTSLPSSSSSNTIPVVNEIQNERYLTIVCTPKGEHCSNITINEVVL